MSRDDLHWPEHLDAVRAAPSHHRVLLENSVVRVLDTRIEPGEIVPLHTHQWPAAYYFVKVGEFVRRDASGTIIADSRKSAVRIEPGQAVWSQPLEAHTLENVGDSTIHVVSVEVKGGS